MRDNHIRCMYHNLHVHGKSSGGPDRPCQCVHDCIRMSITIAMSVLYIAKYITVVV